MNIKLTGKEKRWIMYDVGNSAFALLVSTIIPIYFNYLAGKAGISSVNYLAYWGYAASICTIIVALLGPVCGTLADTKGFKKPVFLISILIGSIACAMLGACVQWLVFLIVFVIAKIGFSSSLIFYDSMLVDVTDEKRMDYVSSQGFAWGYIGSCIPFVGCLLLVLGSSKIGISMEMAMGIAFVIVAVWWLGLSLPHIKKYEQKNYVERKFQEQNFENFNINSENKMAVKVAKDYTNKSIEKMQSEGLIITGESGLGKTHLAASIANKLIENDKIVLMGRLTMLLDMIKETFRDNTKSENELIELYSNVDMIIIDDLGTEKISQWALEKLYTIIQNRNENGLPIIITTRFDKYGLIERFSQSQDRQLVDAIISKLYQMCYVITLKNIKEKELV